MPLSALGNVFGFGNTPIRNRFDSEQRGLVDSLSRAAGGQRGAMASQAALDMGLNRAIAAQRSAAAGATGGPLAQALAQRNAQIQGGQLGAQANLQGAQLALQEQARAQGMLQNSLTAARQDELQRAQLQEQFSQAAATGGAQIAGGFASGLAGGFF